MKRIPKQVISTTSPKILSIKPEIIVQMLKRYGQEVTLREAEIILIFMFELAETSINQVFEDKTELF